MGIPPEHSWHIRGHEFWGKLEAESSWPNKGLFKPMWDATLPRAASEVPIPTWCCALAGHLAVPPKFSPPRPDRAMEWTASAAAGSSKRRGAERGESRRIYLQGSSDSPRSCWQAAAIQPNSAASRLIPGTKNPLRFVPLVSLVRVIPRKIWVREIDVRYAGRMDSSCLRVDRWSNYIKLIWGSQIQSCIETMAVAGSYGVAGTCSDLKTQSAT